MATQSRGFTRISLEFREFGGFERYRKIASLRAYILVYAGPPWVERFAWQQDASWISANTARLMACACFLPPPPYSLGRGVLRRSRPSWLVKAPGWCLIRPYSPGAPQFGLYPYKLTISKRLAPC